MGEILRGLYQDRALRLEKRAETAVVGDFTNARYQHRYGTEALQGAQATTANENGV